MAKEPLQFRQGQLEQIIIALVAILIFWLIGSPQGDETLLGLHVQIWYWAALLTPILHQIIIAPFWRIELLDQRLTQIFGSSKTAFNFFKAIFALFFIPRLTLVIPLAILTKDTIPSPFNGIVLVIGIIFTPVVLYGIYSVKKYFGINRAFGADHFLQSYRELPMVNQGLFRYTSNAMYTFVIAFTWLPAAYLGSLSGMVIGVFSQLFVWIHYFLIEKPDMQFIYRK